MPDSADRVRRLIRTTRFVWSVSAVAVGTLLTAAVAAAFLVTVFAADRLFALPPAVRWIALVCGAVLMMAAVWRWFLDGAPFFASDDRVAVYFDARVAETDNTLVNAVQIAAGGAPGASEAMAAQFLAGAGARLARFSGWEALDGRRLGASLKRAAGPLAVLAACAAISPGGLSNSVHRLLNPSTTAKYAAGVQIDVSPGDAVVPEGGTLEVRAAIHGDVGDVVLEYESSESDEPVRAAMRRGNESFEAEMRGITEGRHYRVTAMPTGARGMGRLLGAVVRWPAVSPTYVIRTVPSPAIEEMALQFTFPAYTGRPPVEERPAKGDIRAPVGTQVVVRGHANKALMQAGLRLGEDTVEGRVSNRDFAASLVVEKSGAYRIDLRDTEGFANVEPAAHTIFAEPDRSPEVALTAPDRDITVAQDATVPLVFAVTDDYGLTSVEWCLNRGDETDAHEVVAAEDGTLCGVEKTILLDLAKLGVAPADILQVWVRATDNRPEEPQTARSRTIHIRVAGVASETERTEVEAQLMARVRALLDEQKKINEDLDMPLAQTIGAAMALDMHGARFEEGADRQQRVAEDAVALANEAAATNCFADEARNALGHLVADAAADAAEGLRDLAAHEAGEHGETAGRVKKDQASVVRTLGQLLNDLADARETPAEPVVETSSSDETAEPKVENEMAERVREDLTEFAQRQREVVEEANRLGKEKVEVPTAEEKASLQALQSAEEDLGHLLEEMVSDLSELPNQDFSRPCLREEIVEILAEVELAEDAFALQNRLMAVSAAEAGLELAAELVHRLPKWLSDMPDHLKWDMEEPPEACDVPMAELPEELTDMMGDLIDEEAAMTEEVEDESSSWADSIDAGAGWGAMDGPISNMSAQGITGNVLPNSSEIAGRSGEGRTGRAHGEFVEETAQGKGGRDTPTRLTPDPFESGVVSDTSTDPVGGATGGGKVSGTGAAGLRGPTPPERQQAMARLADKQADIRNKAERLRFKLDVVNIPVPGLDKAIGAMTAIEEDLRDFRYQNVLDRQDVVLDDLRSSHLVMLQHIKVRGERRTSMPRDEQIEVLDAMDEEVVPEYRDMVADYFRRLAESPR
ncbi:MAG TPA: hypothetical protein PLO37_03765 [Candidatus Hydrogenedentes bacterium]|nr:hypothetical protein [Candidatus Hydrogenedentota bacterium]HPG65939.1 hypothetical protein [Candidatus Hydrogenedentota bacterium]